MSRRRNPSSDHRAQRAAREGDVEAWKAELRRQGYAVPVYEYQVSGQIHHVNFGNDLVAEFNNFAPGPRVRFFWVTAPSTGLPIGDQWYDDPPGMNVDPFWLHPRVQRWAQELLQEGEGKPLVARSLIRPSRPNPPLSPEELQRRRRQLLRDGHSGAMADMLLRREVKPARPADLRGHTRSGQPYHGHGNALGQGESVADAESQGLPWIANPRRPNPSSDERRRELERRAALGDPEALAALQRDVLRAPQDLQQAEAAELLARQENRWAYAVLDELQKMQIAGYTKVTGSKRMSVHAANMIVHAYYVAQGYVAHPITMARWDLYKPDANGELTRRVVFGKRSVRREIAYRDGNGRKLWKRNYNLDQHGSEVLTIDLAEQLIREAKKRLGITA